MACEPLRYNGEFDFKNSELASNIKDNWHWFVVGNIEDITMLKPVCLSASEHRRMGNVVDIS